MGRVGNNKKYENKLFMSIQQTRGTMTDDTAKFLGIETVGMIAFFRNEGKIYISVAKLGDDVSDYKKVARVNGRFGMYTKSLCSSSGAIKAGDYEIKIPPVSVNGKDCYELKVIKYKPKNKLKKIR